MKRILFSLIAVSIFCFSTQAQENNYTIENANELYSEGEYLQAAYIYEEVIKEQGVAPEIYYNLGNAYYKANEIGLSILNYERALRLNPKYEDARFNLELAQSKVIDNIKTDKPFFLKSWLQNLIILLTSNQWLTISCMLFVIALAGFLLFIFGSYKGIRKTSFVLAIILLLISIFTLFFSIKRKNQFTDHDHAIIMVGIVTIKSSPDRNGTDLFELHEGTKIEIKNNLGDWSEIVIGDGRTGWVENRHIEQI